MNTRTPFKWNTANFNWDAVNPTDGKTYPSNELVIGSNKWDDCALIIEIVNVVTNGGSHEEYFDKNKEKKKKFIKLLCKIEGVEYKETKEVLNRKIKISDINLVAKEVLGLEIKINK